MRLIAARSERLGPFGSYAESARCERRKFRLAAGAAEVLLFERDGELRFALWKALPVVIFQFAVCCYKLPLATLGVEEIGGEPDAQWSRIR
jgi:hypothetical protein